MIDVRTVSADVVWPLRHAVLRAGMPAEAARFDGDEGADTLHLAAFDGDAVIGVATLMVRPMPDRSADPAMQLRGMAVAESHRGAGVGARLLHEAMAAGRQRGVAVIWCNARVPAAGFYQRHGFERHGDVFDIPTAGPHYRMSLRL